MKSMTWTMMAVVALGLALPLQAQDDRKFGDTRFLAYEGTQKDWPKGEATQVIKDHVVPIYIGLPNKPYKVLGRVYDPRRSGFGIVTRGIAEGLFSEKDRQRDCANQAKFRGADAVVVTRDETIIKALDLDNREIEKTSPLFEHKNKVVLAVKFEE